MIANALEHGFRQRRRGWIDLRLSSVDDRETWLDVSDDGCAAPDGAMAERRGLHRLRPLGRVSLTDGTRERMTTVRLIILTPPGG